MGRALVQSEPAAISEIFEPGGTASSTRARTNLTASASFATECVADRAARTRSSIRLRCSCERFRHGRLGELDVGIRGDGSPLDDFIVTDPSIATHRRYRNRQTGEVITARI